MNRRTFLKLTPLAAAPIGDLAAAGIVDYSPRDERAGGPDWPEPEFLHGNYRVVWTGWKPAMATHEIAAQWIAYHLEQDVMFCVNMPNLKGGRVERGSCFDIQATRSAIDLTMEAEGRRLLMVRGRAYLMWMLDHPDQVTWTQWGQPVSAPEF